MINIESDSDQDGDLGSQIDKYRPVNRAMCLIYDINADHLDQ